MYSPKKMIRDFRPELMEVLIGVLLIWISYNFFYWPPKLELSDVAIFLGMPIGVGLITASLLSPPDGIDRADTIRMVLDALAFVVFFIFAFNAYEVENITQVGSYGLMALICVLCGYKSGKHMVRG